MILYVNGLLKESTDPLDLLTRSVVISLFPGGVPKVTTGHQNLMAGGAIPGRRYRTTGSAPVCIC